MLPLPPPPEPTEATAEPARDPSRPYMLDFIDGYADGILDLPGEQAERWQEVLTADYYRLRREVRHGRDTCLGDYAATSKTEFFATASERFFTQPAKLRHSHPQLYQMLKVAYAVNPAKWFARQS
jgi:Mlc titration factor MtfA (ptsG expression regulator)